MNRAETIRELNSHFDMYVAHSASRDLVGTVEALGELIYFAQDAMKTLSLTDDKVAKVVSAVKLSHRSSAQRVPPTVAIRGLTDELCNCTK